VRNDDEADPDAQLRAERARCPCPCPCAHGERDGSVVSRVRVQVLLRQEKSVSGPKSVLAGGESEGSTPAAADGRGRGKGARTVARG
jgi:hypothetical protein